MLQDKLKEKKGFTIIEVVIVLAIAALIITIVLLAVAALQRSQRTKAMQDAAGRLLSQAENWVSDQGGATVLDGTLLTAGQYDENARLPNGTAAAFSAGAGPTTKAAMNYHTGTCNSDGSITSTTDPSQIAVSYFSEQSGRAVCISN